MVLESNSEGHRKTRCQEMSVSHVHQHIEHNLTGDIYTMKMNCYRDQKVLFCVATTRVLWYKISFVILLTQDQYIILYPFKI